MFVSSSCKYSEVLTGAPEALQEVSGEVVGLG